MLKNKGFTLVELSIVLVIIGLVVGGILVGQDMIQSGKNRKALSKVQEYRTATNLYLERHRSLPGDSRRSGGNEDGFITSPTAPIGSGLFPSDTIGEVFQFFTALSNERFIKETFQPLPHIAFDTFPLINGEALLVPINYSGTGALNPHMIGRNVFVIGHDHGFTPLITELSSQTQLKPAAVDYIDKKIDDGIPLSGIVDGGVIIGYGSSQALNSDGITYEPIDPFDPFSPVVPVPGGTPCITGTTYAISVNETSCQLIITIQ